MERPYPRDAAQAGFWDSVASTRTFGHPIDVERLGRRIEPDARLLDYGCGYGRLGRLLFNRGYPRVVGVDGAPAMVARARAENPGLPFAVIGADLPFADGAFDGALLFTLLTSVPEDGAQRRILDETARVLGPGGVVYISDMPLQDDDRNRRRYEAFADEYDCYGVFRLPEGAVVRHHDRAWIDALAGWFEPLWEREVEVRTMNGNPATAFQFIGRKV